MNKKFVTAINCMDGRAQEPIIKFMKEKFQADYVDNITEPGPNKILAEASNAELVESIKKRVAISVFKHFSKIIAIIGHHDCSGNPSSDLEQKNHLKRSLENIRSWDFPVQKIILIWLDESFQPAEISFK